MLSQWSPNTQVLFTWCEFLRSELPKFLNLENGLVLNITLINDNEERKLSEQIESASSASANSQIDHRHSELSVENLMQILIDYDRSQHIIEFQKVPHECPVCLMERPGNQSIFIDGCKHVICKDCISTFLEDLIAAGRVFTIECPAASCHTELHPNFIQAHVSTKHYERYERLLFETGLSTMEDVTYCPRRMCGKPVIVERDSTVATCAHCYYTFCTKCGLSSHGVTPCEIRGKIVCCAYPLIIPQFKINNESE